MRYTLKVVAMVTPPRWEDYIQHAMMSTQAMLSPESPSSPDPLGDDYAGRLPLGLSTHTSHFNTRGREEGREEEVGTSGGCGFIMPYQPDDLQLFVPPSLPPSLPPSFRATG